MPGNNVGEILLKNGLLVLAACFVYFLERPKKLII
jgi:hypothetical protein